ncbi:transcription repressor NadR [Bacillus alkalicellulosilyticus]|uniref:transcription repressor NadR n=1 Tax=Alkalihalobacterium alkalicellulosilyticum TaxID=1912214 RepID=UPI000996B36F|nr:transcription repressor NadR [Bacillus alkalicellulosilyticus]
MTGKRKVLGEERRKLLLHWLLETTEPITGNDFADRTNVSRQVIVQDISILKAKNHPIIATAQGYMYLKKDTRYIQKVIACQHSPAETEAELTILVDHGVTIKDVMVEHPVYGDITGSLMIANRRDIKSFIEKITSTGATLLSELTDGVHLHTIEGSSEEQLTEAIQALRNAGYLLKAT